MAPNPRKVDCYRIRVGHFEWAEVILDEDTGMFLAHSSFGTYAHHWPPAYRHEPLDQFVSTLDFGYFMSKVRGHQYLEFDAKLTIARMREEIISERRQGNFDATQAREAWDDLDDMDAQGYQSSEAFGNDLSERPVLLAFLGPDWWEMFRTSPKPECLGFWDTIMPTLITKLMCDRHNGGLLENTDASL